MQQKRLLWDMYVCVLGGGIWKGIHSMKTEGITDTKFGRVTYIWGHRECCQGGMHRALKSRGNAGFLIWLGSRYIRVCVRSLFFVENNYVHYICIKVFPILIIKRKRSLFLKNCGKQWCKAETGDRLDVARRTKVLLLPWESILANETAPSALQLQFIRDGTWA